MAAIIAKRLHIPAIHTEAENRSFDQNAPEEVNRRIVERAGSIILFGLDPKSVKATPTARLHEPK